MKKLCRIEILLLMLFMALLSVHSAMGKDVSDDTKKTTENICEQNVFRNL